MTVSLQLSTINFPSGAYIFVEGKHKAEAFFIIRTGNVKISKETDVLGEKHQIRGPGDFFGVVATMSSHTHIETARAITDVSLLAVRREQYGLLIEKNTPVAMKIIEQFSRRMRQLDEMMGSRTNKAEGKESKELLFELGEYYLKQSQYNMAFYAYENYVNLFPGGGQAADAGERIKKIASYVTLGQRAPDVNFTKTYPKNTMIFAESMPGSELYIIQKGSVKISKFAGGSEVLLAILKEGDIFGEMALIENKPRSASAIAYEDVTLLAVTRENFARMVSDRPQLIARLTQLLAERIWLMYKQLSTTLQHNPLGKLYDTLLVQLEKERVGLREGDAYTFNFGPRELINMAGLPSSEGDRALHDLLQNRGLQVTGGRLATKNVFEILSRAIYFRKLQKLSMKSKQKEEAVSHNR